ncbi:unnamed protein product [Amoebophrya sp. A25]|nr:unnamed protein product [Amoebophrya sp. A25]|eukprot:GSA25T00012476001.1
MSTTSGQQQGEHAEDGQDEDNDDIDPRFQFSAPEPPPGSADPDKIASNVGPQMPTKVHRSNRQLADDFSNPVLNYFKKMGWQGGGLGKNEQGRANPLLGAYNRKKNQAIQELGTGAEAKQEVDDRAKPDARSAKDILLGRGADKGGAKSGRDVIPGLGEHMSRKEKMRSAKIDDEDLYGSKKNRRERTEYYEDQESGDLVSKSSMRIVDMTKAGGPQLVGGNLADAMLEKRDRPLDELLRSLTKLTLKTNEDVILLRNQVRDYQSSLDVLRGEDGGPLSSGVESGGSSSSGSPVRNNRGTTSGRAANRKKHQSSELADVETMETLLDDMDEHFSSTKNTSSKNNKNLRSQSAFLGSLTASGGNEQAEAEILKVLEYFEHVKKKHGKRFFAKFELDLICAEHLLPPLRNLVNLWDPIDDPEELDPILTRIRDLLIGTSGTTGTSSCSSLDSSKPYILLMQQTVYQRIRAGIGSEDFRPAESAAGCGECLLLLTTAGKFLPTFCVTNLNRLNVLPKLRDAAHNWSPATNFGPHSWLFAFREYLTSEDLREVGSICKQRLASFISSSWRPLAGGEGEDTEGEDSCEEDDRMAGRMNGGRPSRAKKNTKNRLNSAPNGANAALLAMVAPLIAGGTGVLSVEESADLEQRICDRLRQVLQPDDSDEVLHTLAPWLRHVFAKSNSPAFQVLFDDLFFLPLRRNLKRLLLARSKDSLRERRAVRAAVERFYHRVRLAVLGKPFAGVAGMKSTLHQQLLKSEGKTVLPPADDTFQQLGYLLEVLECHVVDLRNTGGASFYVLEADGLETGPRLDATTWRQRQEELEGAANTVRGKGAAGAANGRGVNDNKNGPSGAPPRSEREKALHRYAEMLRDEQKRAREQREFSMHMEEPDLTIKQVLENAAADLGAEMSIKSGFLSATGKQWYSVSLGGSVTAGGAGNNNRASKKTTLFIYWENDILFCTTDLQDRKSIRPITIENLLTKLQEPPSSRK